MKLARHRPGGWLVWLLLAACAALVVVAMTWLTRETLASERSRLTAEARADLQERVRLALWRMDSAGAAILLEENQRPATEIHAGTSPPVEAGAPELVKTRFDLSEGGRIVVPGGDPALAGEIRTMLGSSDTRNAFAGACSALLGGEQAWNQNVANTTQQVQQEGLRQSDGYQVAANQKEQQARGRYVDNTLNRTKAGQNLNLEIQGVLQIGSMPDSGLFRPAWIGPDLVLLRQVKWQAPAAADPFAQQEAVPAAQARPGIQGVLLQAAAVRGHLLAEVGDLLPSADLQPAREADPGDAMTLASLPWRLVPGPVAAPVAGSFGLPVKTSLAAGWLAALIAIGGAAVLVQGVMRLSERRASFVSAVTHELRTPLTTFRLYSDMLESGAVKEERRGDYFRTLRREADRLAHLVENVLAFSRVERGSARARVRRTTVRDLLEPMRERFASRLASAGMTLDLAYENGAGERTLETDTAAVEHVLFNLVDNAAKYAATGEPACLAIRVLEEDGGVSIRVRDHGPGIPEHERRRIFRPFHKSAEAAAESRPGVGLGLALSRRLARETGGRLDLLRGESPGAVFRLWLPG